MLCSLYAILLPTILSGLPGLLWPADRSLPLHHQLSTCFYLSISFRMTCNLSLHLLITSLVASISRRLLSSMLDCLSFRETPPFRLIILISVLSIIYACSAVLAHVSHPYNKQLLMHAVSAWPFIIRYGILPVKKGASSLIYLQVYPLPPLLLHLPLPPCLACHTDSRNYRQCHTFSIHECWSHSPTLLTYECCTLCLPCFLQSYSLCRLSL